MKKTVEVDITVLFSLADGFRLNRAHNLRVTGLFNRIRAAIAVLIGRHALALTTLAFKILPNEQPFKLPNTLVRPELLAMATEKLPDRKVDNLGYAGPQSFSPVTLSREVRNPAELLDRDLAEMHAGFSVRKIK